MAKLNGISETIKSEMNSKYEMTNVRLDEYEKM